MQKQALYCKEKSSFVLEENVYGVLYALIEEADISEAFFTCLYFSASCQTTTPFPAPPQTGWASHMNVRSIDLGPIPSTNVTDAHAIPIRALVEYHKIRREKNKMSRKSEEG